jgi:hypothetical protein
MRPEPAAWCKRSFSHFFSYQSSSIGGRIIATLHRLVHFGRVVGHYEVTPILHRQIFAGGRYTVRMKTQSPTKNCWHIRGYDGTTEIFDQSVSVRQMTESGIKDLLRALVAKILSPPELIGAYSKRGTPVSNNLLMVRKKIQPAKERALYTCGTNPHYIATTETISLRSCQYRLKNPILQPSQRNELQMSMPKTNPSKHPIPNRK